MKLKQLLFLLLFSTTSLYAQDKVLGVVIEEDVNGKEVPLPGANVYWLGTTQGVVTAGNGVFLLPKTTETNQLVVSYVGYKSDTLTVDGDSNLKVILEPDSELEEVTIEGWKPSSGVDYLKGINTIEMSEDELFKAACCNLSESFETNPSVDVSFTDAVTGTKQIQMLGLAGSNTMISVENMPGIRGLASNYGLSYIPGTWINSIQVTKGVGSVVNGHESIAGHINVELKKPQDSEKLFLNGYVNQSGRSELNVVTTQMVGKKWATTTLLHGSVRPFENDMNDDGFLDFPRSNQVNFVNRWIYKGDKGWIGQFGVKAMTDNKLGGEVAFNEDQPRTTNNPYGVNIETNRYEGFGKLGYVFEGTPYKSFGFQFSAIKHEQDSYFGLNDYNADQNTIYGNFIFQSILGNTSHKFKTGISYIYDSYDEQLNTLDFDREEHVPGVFYEYTYDNLDDLTIIAGVRLDYNSLFGEIITPRLHVRYNPWDATTIRLSGGRGTRTANIIAENTSVLASSRSVRFENQQINDAYGYVQDKAWNFGANLTQDFRLNYKEGVLNLDFYHTRFDDQVILDLDRNAQEAVFTSMLGDSYANSIQAQVDYELVRNLDIRMAYRWLDVQVDYTSGQLQKPLVPKNRAFFNAEYKTKSNWAFDYTLQWTGEQRIPNTTENPEQYQAESFSPDFITMNAQITKSFNKGWDVYVGVENAANYTQDDPILASAEPFSPYFDSS
ncbi:TonB-dependent receptor, partial [Fulvivirga aurantia]|uniref:TonB-dependent receptor n=1 Tax=Fulvivirga aurantia TaxID=2529383 RepID=UPI00162A60CF